MVKFSGSRGNYYRKRYDHVINAYIKASSLRVIDGEENLGVISRDEALQRARSQDLDLVLISADANPPVAKILDYSKFLYEEKKKKAASKAKSKKSEVKELRLSAKIGEGDLIKRAERTVNFVKEGNRVKISIFLRGREAAYPEIALEKIKRFTQEVEGTAKLEAQPKVQGKIITAVYIAN